MRPVNGVLANRFQPGGIAQGVMTLIYLVISERLMVIICRLQPGDKSPGND